MYVCIYAIEIFLCTYYLFKMPVCTRITVPMKWMHKIRANNHKFTCEYTGQSIVFRSSYIDEHIRYSYTIYTIYSMLYIYIYAHLYIYINVYCQLLRSVIANTPTHTHIYTIKSVCMHMFM